LEKVIRGLCPQLIRFVAHVSKGTARHLDREEILQEALCRVIASQVDGRVDVNRPMWPYLLGTIANIFAEFRRNDAKTNRLRTRLVERMDSFQQSHQPDLTAFLRLALTQLETWLSNQPPMCKEIWERRFIAGQTERAVAEALGISRRQLRIIERQLHERLGHFRRQGPAGRPPGLLPSPFTMGAGVRPK
jgi:RNA polymerase sigma factor (sigma-70 family)